MNKQIKLNYAYEAVIVSEQNDGENRMAPDMITNHGTLRNHIFFVVRWTCCVLFHVIKRQYFLIFGAFMIETSNFKTMNRMVNAITVITVVFPFRISLFCSMCSKHHEHIHFNAPQNSRNCYVMGGGRGTRTPQHFD